MDKEWRMEYKKDLIFLYNCLINILKRRNLLYKEYSFESFCELVYKTNG